ncbi:nicolin-1 isoform X3 [Rissa tridactyla]|uniref:nicolin-1 isoform X3 n=1 Tax=Rissa tridactyla TaxID=75485 RepID=UPI0023BACFAB|nr:nicolin-1 isoform X3 [Rissa tridactyla]
MSGAPGPGPGRSPLPCAPRPAAVLQLGGGAEPARPGVAVIDLRFPRGAAADMLCDVDQVTAVRFILRQPSPVWLHFTIEELQIFPPGPKVGSKLQHTAWCEGWRWDWGHPSCDPLDLFQSPQKDFPSWLSQLTPPEQPASLHGELPDPEKVSTEVQQMWVLTEVIRARQAAARIGRFDVDGCYDINLLSYT